MKTLKLITLLLISPFVFHAQQSLTGLWTGTLTNDSVTVRNDQAFEIALTQYKDKVYGYSRNSFIVNDTFYYVLKRVKGTIDGDICEIKDDEIVSFNFPGKLDKGVRVTITFRRNLQDSVWHLTGDWKTNKTKKFYAISGKVEMKSEPDFTKSKIFPHLEELKIDNDVAFYAASKKAPAQQQQKELISRSSHVVAINQPAEAARNTSESPFDENATASAPHTVDQKADKKAEEALSEPVALRKSELPASTIPGSARKNVNGNLPQPEARRQEGYIKRESPAVAPSLEEQAATANKKSEQATAATSTERKINIENSSVAPIKVGGPAAFVTERKTMTPQVISFKSDSLQLALYDNGEVDGDTVSVLLNGEILLARQGLKAAAIRKTIYLPPGSNEVSLVLYAENLGKYPPNTGLLVVHDGDDTYQVRFSADLQQNAAVVFRRKQ